MMLCSLQFETHNISVILLFFVLLIKLCFEQSLAPIHIIISMLEYKVLVEKKMDMDQQVLVKVSLEIQVCLIYMLLEEVKLQVIQPQCCNLYTYNMPTLSQDISLLYYMNMIHTSNNSTIHPYIYLCRNAYHVHILLDDKKLVVIHLNYCNKHLQYYQSLFGNIHLVHTSQSSQYVFLVLGNISDLLHIDYPGLQYKDPNQLYIMLLWYKHVPQLLLKQAP